MKSPIPVLLLLVSFFLPTFASAGTRWSDGIAAVKVIGQPDFTNNAGTNTVDRLSFPEDVAIDPVSGKIFVADTGNNRVLRFASYAALTNGAAAEAVIGQSTFEATGGRNVQDGLFAPSGVYVDNEGRLWVSDKNNNRILRYDNAAPLADGPLADGILGQTGYGVSGAGISQTRVWNPKGITGDDEGNLFVVDAEGRLWVADSANGRILGYENASTAGNGAAATLVLGRPDFTLDAAPEVSASRLESPYGIEVDGNGRLHVCDRANSRVLFYSPSTFQPDLTIGAKIGSQRGAGVINVSGAGQKQITVTAGKRVKFFTFLRNGGNVTDRYAVTSGKPDSRTDIKVYRVTGGRANVTATTKTGLHQTADLAGGAASQYELQMKAKGKSAKEKGTFKTFLQGRSVIDGASDRVLAWIKNRP